MKKKAQILPGNQTRTGSHLNRATSVSNSNKGDGNVPKQGRSVADDKKLPEGFEPAIDENDEDVRNAKDQRTGDRLKKGFPMRDRTLDDENQRRNTYYGLPPDFGPSYGNVDCECGLSYTTAMSERPFCPACGRAVKVVETKLEPHISGETKVCPECASKQYTLTCCTLCGTTINSEESMKLKKLKVKAGDTILFTVNNKKFEGIVASVDYKADKAKVAAGDKAIIVAGVHVVKKVKAEQMGVKDVDQTDVKSKEDGDEEITINLKDEEEAKSFDEEINEGDKDQPSDKDPIDEQMNEQNDDSSTENLNVKASTKKSRVKAEDQAGNNEADKGANKEPLNDQLNDEELTAEDIEDLAKDEDEEVGSEDDELEELGSEDEEIENLEEISGEDEDEDEEVELDIDMGEEEEETESGDTYDMESEDDHGQSDYDTNENEEDLSSAPAEGSDEEVEDEDEDAEGCSMKTKSGDEEEVEDDEEAEAKDMLTFTLAADKLNEDGITADRVAAHLFNAGTENPQWNITVDGIPVAAICLADQQKPNEVAAYFVSADYGDTIRAAIEEHGLSNILRTVNARFFVNEVDNKALAKKMQQKAEAKLESIYQEKILAMVNEFADAFRITVAGYNKNFWDAKNFLKAGLYDQFKRLGIRNPMPYIEAAFAEHGDTFFDQAINKAIEIMAKSKETRNEIRDMVQAAEHSYVAVAAAEEIQDEQYEVHARLTEGNFPVDTNQVPRGNARPKFHFGRGLGLNG